MMKKLIFCLMMLTGAGMLNSCQQDEVVDEVPASKGVTIRASLPSDAQSRVSLGETLVSEGKSYTKVKWDGNEKITLTISSQGSNETASHTFNFVKYGKDNEGNVDKSTAEFSCEDNIAIDSDKIYTFTCGTDNSTKERLIFANDLKNYYPIVYEYRPEANHTWDDVELAFSAQVVLVEISWPTIDINHNFYTNVYIYNAKTGACFASGGTVINDKKIYFKADPKSYEAIFIVKNNDKVYGKKVENRELSVDKLYKVELTASNEMANIQSSTVKYFTQDENKTCCVFGNGSNRIPSNAFYGTVNEVINSLFILDGIIEIGSDAFRHSKLNRVIIPATVSKIEYNAFYNCNSGCNFYVMPTTPPSLGTNVFGMNPEKNNYYVPSNTKNGYDETERWKVFKNEIQELPNNYN